MADPAPAEPCTFKGTAASVRVQGRGAAVLLERAPFEQGNAAKVVLDGAVLLHDDAPVRPPGRREITFDRPAELLPIKMSPPGRSYDVTYSAGPPVVIHVATGGDLGAFRGALPDSTECARAWCDVVWSGDQKTVTLERATQEPSTLTQGFPFSGAALSDERPSLEVVTLEGVRGELQCRGAAAPVKVDDARQVWKAGEHRSLSVEPIGLGPEGLAVVVANERAPERTQPGGGVATGLIVGGIAAALLLTGAAFAFRRRRRSGPRPAGGVAAGAPVRPVTLFYSYAEEDERLRDQLEKHLKVLERLGLLEGWHERRVEPGAERQRMIDARLDEADIVLLLVSKDFLASDYCYGVEMERALARHANGAVRVIPVLLKPCLWKDTLLGELEVLPRDGRPITQWADAEAALEDVAQGIRRAIEAIRERRGARQSVPEEPRV